jgi:hypothetical protein
MLPPRNDADTGTIAASHEAEAVVLDFYCHQALRKSSGSLAILAAILRASSFVSSLAADRWPFLPTADVARFHAR